MYARNPEEAQDCLALLQAFDIDGRLESDLIGQEDIALLVPAEDLEQASHLLASRAQDEGGTDEEEEGGVDDADDEEVDDDDDFDDDLDDDDDFEEDEEEEKGPDDDV